MGALADKNMSLESFLAHLTPFKIYIYVVFIMLNLTLYYISVDSFLYAVKKEDSPGNLNAAMVKGIIMGFISIAFSLFLFWLSMQNW